MDIINLSIFNSKSNEANGIVRLFRKILLFLPLLILLVGLNVFVDPAHIFSSGEYEKKIASILLEKKNVLNVTDGDERMLQRYYINGLKQQKDIVILGSSRSKGISIALFPGKDLFNNSVNGASIEDYMSIYQLYRDKGLLPKLLVIGVDPWILNRNSGQERWRSLSPEYSKIEKMTGVTLHKDDGCYLQKIAQIFSLSYFQASMRALKIKIFILKKKMETYIPILKDEDTDFAIRQFDGSIQYNQKTKNRSKQNVTIRAASFAAASPIYSLGNFNRLDPDLMNSLESFINIIKKDGVDIVFFLPSYHPLVYKKLTTSSKYKIILEAQRYIVQMALARNIRVIGSYNPDECQLSEDDFIDGMHIKKEAFRKIFGSIK